MQKFLDYFSKAYLNRPEYSNSRGAIHLAISVITGTEHCQILTTAGEGKFCWFPNFIKVETKAQDHTTKKKKKKIQDFD